MTGPPPADIPEDQQRIRARCVHPAGTFVGFGADELEQSIPARFERQVRRYPERLAVKTRSHRLSYAELNRAANRVARAILTRRGEGNEPVAVLLDQGAAAATLWVLKAGKVYVPLDPAFPAARLAYMLGDARHADRLSGPRRVPGDGAAPGPARGVHGRRDGGRHRGAHGGEGRSVD